MSDIGDGAIGMLQIDTAVTVAIVTLAVNIVFRLFGDGWGIAGRLSKIDANLIATQAELKKLSDVLVDLSDMRGEMRVFDVRLGAAEQDIRELRHGEGFVRGPRGIDREYP